MPTSRRYSLRITAARPRQQFKTRPRVNHGRLRQTQSLHFLLFRFQHWRSARVSESATSPTTTATTGFPAQANRLENSRITTSTMARQVQASKSAASHSTISMTGRQPRASELAISLTTISMMGHPQLVSALGTSRTTILAMGSRARISKSAPSVIRTADSPAL
jgi:hypothetical protein